MVKKKSLLLVALFLGFDALAYGGILYGEYVAEQAVRKQAQKVMNLMASMADVSYRDLKVSAIHQRMSIEGIRVKLSRTDTEFNIDRLVISDVDPHYLLNLALGKIDFSKDVPHSYRAEVVGLNVPLQSLPSESAEILREMGLPNLKLGFSQSFRFDSQSEVVTNRIGFSVLGMGELSMSLSLGSFDLPNVIQALRGPDGRPNPAMALQYLGVISLVQAELRFVDASLMQRLAYVSYQRFQTTPAHEFKKYSKLYIDQAKNRMLRQVASVKGDQVVDLATALKKQNEAPASLPANLQPEVIVAQLQKFLDQPKSLALISAPTSPLPIAKFLRIQEMEPEEILSMFNLQVTAN